ncbi:hypothetical protein ABIG06_003866 [Bradyrhizobium sp. USDA 326]
MPTLSSPAAIRNRPAHHGGEDDAVDAVTLRGRCDQNDERARRPADLEAAAAEQGGDEAADDGGIETAVRRHA